MAVFAVGYFAALLLLAVMGQRGQRAFALAAWIALVACLPLAFSTP